MKIIRNFVLKTLVYLLLGLLTAGTILPTQAVSKIISEAQLSDLHAALVLKIALFVEWPDTMEEFAEEKVTLGVLGNDEIYESFIRLSHKKIRGKETLISHNPRVDNYSSNQILFISDTQEMEMDLWPGVLTIGTSQNFNAQGGIIKLSIENGKPRFSINLRAAEAAGIGFSSKLLKITTIFEEDIQ